jgi:hypothetical protein
VLPSYRSFDVLAELQGVAGLSPGVRVEHEWVRTLPAPDFIGMGLSSTKLRAAIDRFGEARIRAELEQLLARYANDRGEVDVPYQTELFMSYRQPSE